MKQFLFILFALFLSCNQAKKEKTLSNEELCEQLAQIHLIDQKYRGLEEMVDPFFPILDSLISAHGMTHKEYGKLTDKEQLGFGKIARGIANTRPNISQAKEDSLMTLQSKLDIENTKNFIKIVKEYGFPSIVDLDCKDYAAPFLVFGHAPKEFWEEINDLIEKEKIAGRLKDGDYKYIKWHTGGRETIKTDSNEIIEISAN